MFYNLFGNGIGLMVIVVLAILVVFMAIRLYAQAHPTSKVAVDLNKAETDVSGFETRAAADIRAAAEKVEPTVTTLGKDIRTEAEKLLEKTESWITDTSAEDNKINEYNGKIAEQQASKANKLALGRAHVERLQAALAAAGTGS